MHKNQKKYAFEELVLLALQGEITAEQMEQLDHILIEDSAKVCDYVELMEIYSELSLSGSVEIPAEETNVTEEYNNLLQLLASEENAAHKIDLPEEQPHQELIQKVVYPDKEKRKISRFQIFVLILNTAAILFLALFVKFFPKGQNNVDVATLVDQIDAKWVRTDNIPETGSRLWTNKMPLYLQSGIVKVRYDDGVEVLVEGPAGFEILKSAMFMEYGRLYSRVPDTGLGFTVRTPTTQFVDLGTEFGAQADINGSAELHVFKGKVQLFAGPKEKTKTSLEVTENKAVHYDAGTFKVNDIPIKKQSYVRSIDSKTKTIWHGQKTIDLADIIGGGNGFGNGQIGKGIDLINGKKTTTTGVGFFTGTGRYIQTNWSEFIDGVFVPDGGQGSVQISSEGHVFSNCPDTTGIFFDPIMNGGSLTYLHTSEKTEMKLNGQVYGTKQAPALYIHTNAGITYDLQAMQRANPHGRIKKFNAIVGISENSAGRLSESNIYVLLDGKVCFSATGITMKDIPVPINIEINSGAKYLTLISTDGGDKTDVDWVVFAEPVLELAI